MRTQEVTPSRSYQGDKIVSIRKLTTASSSLLRRQQQPSPLQKQDRCFRQNHGVSRGEHKTQMAENQQEFGLVPK
jgi:hypothetical protein